MMDVRRILKDLDKRVSNFAARCVIKLVDDAAKLQRLQVTVLADEVRDGVERVQQYGFTSAPKVGAEAVVLFVGGRRDHGLVIAVDDRRYRLTGLKEGEVAIYTDEGDHVVIKRGGTIEVKAATKLVVDSPLVELAGNGDLVGMASKIEAELNKLRTAVNANTTKFNAHTHVVAGTAAAAVIPAQQMASAPTVSAVGSQKVKLS